MSAFFSEKQTIRLHPHFKTFDGMKASVRFRDKADIAAAIRLDRKPCSTWISSPDAAFFNSQIKDWTSVFARAWLLASQTMIYVGPPALSNDRGSGQWKRWIVQRQAGDSRCHQQNQNHKPSQQRLLHCYREPKVQPSMRFAKQRTGSPIAFAHF